MTSNPADWKTCPFCGRDPKITNRASTDTATREVWFISCRCGGNSATAHKWGPTLNEALAAWNTRAALQQSRSAVVLDAIINVRAANAVNLKRSGAVWEAYDRAVLDCHAAVTAALSQESAGE